MNRKALRILEYNKIKDMLAQECGSALSRRMAHGLHPRTDIEDIRNDLRSTTEAVGLVVRKGAVPAEGLYDVRGIADLARKGGVLTMRQLLMVHTDLAIASETIRFLKGDLPEMPHIMEIAELVQTDSALEERIDRSILSEDEMADDASPDLRKIRADIRRQSQAIRTRLDRIVSSQDNRLYLQDALVTMRDGRFVIPVKSQYRQKFPGIVHDQSKGGATLFVEPQVIIDMNNELRELGLAEEAEIQRVLSELSEWTARDALLLTSNQKLLTELDFIMAKAKLSLRMDAREPRLNEEGQIKLKKARHPLLDPKTAVPVSVELGGSFRTLVVTGPNTGGKTLTLKTVGLLQLMAQSGLHIPASEESELPVYQNVYADIGDEQSIEQSLSTFSSHMKNIVFILERARDGVLVLLDELGAGTDPAEGAALGVAVLERLLALGAETVATTHYTEIKKYALATEGVENASMEFDVATLRPTYRLLIGVPGKSNAFAISKRLGLPDPVIERAQSLLNGEEIRFDDLMASIEQDRREAEADREDAARLSGEARENAAQAAKERGEVEESREKILQDARREAREILKGAREAAEEARSELLALKDVDNFAERNAQYARTRQKLTEAENRYKDRIVRRVNSNPVRASELRVGDRVKLLTIGQNAEILTLPDEKGDLMVRAGVMRMKANVKDLVLLNDGSRKARKKKAVSVSSSRVFSGKTASVSPEIDVRGENLDDARMDVEKYLDDVSMSGLTEVTIIHGRGEGILRSGIRQFLRTNRHVDSFRPGAYNEGGEGVTIVTMRK